MKEPQINIARIKNEVLTWLETMRIPGHCFKFRYSSNSGNSIFCTCFALFIIDLFQEIDCLSSKTKLQLTSYLQGHQHKSDGYFEPDTIFHKDKDRIRQQLTTLCLSALNILGVGPKYPLKFMEKWQKPIDIITYLTKNQTHDGFDGSGNKAMFLAIFLTYEYERTGNSLYLDLIDTWFNFHDTYQNKNGFWGNKKANLYYKGLQNAFHQLEIYFYWKRTVPKLTKIVDITLAMQDKDGFFAPTPGGGPCKDYDAINILTNSFQFNKYRSEEKLKSLGKSLEAVLSCQNDDGGFCRSKQWPLNKSSNNIKNLIRIKNAKFIFHGNRPYFWFYRTKMFVYDVLKKKNKYISSWVRGGHYFYESDLFSTWFRCLAIAQILSILYPENCLKDHFRFQRTIGLGYFEKQ